MSAKADDVKTDIEIADPCIVPSGWNILQRMNWVRSQISYIQKDAKVGFGNSTYKAVRHDAVTGMVRPFLIQSGIVTTQTLKSAQTVDSGSTTKNGVPIIRYEAIYVISFESVIPSDDMKAVVVEVEAHALDQGDKAPGKAMSYAKKYAYLKEFDIETGEDEESRIEQKSANDMEAEKEALARERVSNAISQHMDSIKVIKTAIKDAEPTIIDRQQRKVEFGNEPEITGAIEAWYELTEDEQRSLWVAPSKGGPFSTDERIIMRSDRWTDLYRESRGFPAYDRGKK